jgi:rRNA methylase
VPARHPYPSDPAFSSLNLGAAVQVLAYTVRMAMLGEVAPAAAEPGPRELPAAHGQLEGFYTQLGQTLDMIDFHKGAAPIRPCASCAGCLARLH